MRTVKINLGTIAQVNLRVTSQADSDKENQSKKAIKKRDHGKIDQNRKAIKKKDQPKQEGYKKEGSWQGKPKQEGYKKEGSWQGKPKQEGYKKEGSWQGKPKQEGYRKEAFKQDAPKQEDYKQKGFRGRDNRPNRFEQDKFEEERPIDENILYGRNAVIEALKAGRDIDKLLVQKGEKEGSIIKIVGEAKDKGIVIIEAEKSKLDEITGREKHQGVVAYAAAQSYVEIDDILQEAKDKDEPPFVLILENIQDPHNLGAIIRSAHNAGVHGIIIPKRRAVGLSGTVAKSSAGAIEYMKVAKVTNIAQTIKELQEKGLWIACADMDGKMMYEENLTGPIAIVVGSEGEGVSKLAKEGCDYVISIPMYGKVSSLNASVAASVMVYEVVRQRKFKG
ncbi:MAG: methyltransferase, TrmH family, group 3 [Clostridia bacterium]|nr:methyltransferase, TrmH family, group 3 [Clostridia bacterium]